jgi:hypothetical protein
MTTERDNRTRIVLSWLREETHENAERVLLRALEEVDATPQRRSWWPAWRTNRMKTFANLIAAAAAVLVVVIVGYQFLPGNGGIGGQPTIAPPPSPALLARGTFVIRDWDTVEFEATREGSSVTGRMTVGLKEGTSDFLRVDLQCARTTEDGLIMIGGYTDGAGGRFAGMHEGTFAAIALKRGSPVKAQIWAYGSAPWTPTTDCVANLDGWLTEERTRFPDEIWLRDDIEGTVEFGP